jgi:hypothetical protein
MLLHLSRRLATSDQHAQLHVDREGALLYSSPKFWRGKSLK